MSQSISATLTTTCRACGLQKPASEYYSDKSKKRGHGTECKACVGERTRTRYMADREAWIARSTATKRANPERSRAYGRSYSMRHREQTAAREAAYRRSHSDRYRDHARAWAAANPERVRELGRLNASLRRARIAGGTVRRVTDGDLARALRRHNSSCAYCGQDVSTGVQWDHVVPIARGGQHSIGNLLPSCAPCNQSKGAKTLTEWRRSCSR